MTGWRAARSYEAREYPGEWWEKMVAVRPDPDLHDTLLCWVGWLDGPTVSVGVVCHDRVVATTDSMSTWERVERVLPRDAWPSEVFAADMPHEATLDLRALIDAELQRVRDDIARVEREEVEE